MPSLVVQSYEFLSYIVIVQCMYSEHPPPQSLLTLHRQAESEEGWLMVLRSIVDTIPIDDPLGPAVVNLIIEECPLPSKVIC